MRGDETRLLTVERGVGELLRMAQKSRLRLIAAGQGIREAESPLSTPDTTMICIATITVVGCHSVLLAGVTVTATLTGGGGTPVVGTTNGSGVVVLALTGGINSSYGINWTVTVTPPDVRYAAGVQAWNVYGSSTSFAVLTPPNYPNYNCFNSCPHPVPTTLYLRDGLGMVVMLTYDGSYQVWNGCDTGTVVSAVTTKDCSGAFGSGGVIPRYWTLQSLTSTTMNVYARYPSTLLSFGGTPIRGVSSATWCPLAPFNAGTFIPGCTSFVGVNSVGSNSGTFTCSPFSCSMTGVAGATPQVNNWSMFYSPSSTTTFTISET